MPEYSWIFADRTLTDDVLNPPTALKVNKKAERHRVQRMAGIATELRFPLCRQAIR